jgi:hypothetical protein
VNECRGGAHDIRNGVGGAHFVEVHLLDLEAVHARLSLCETPEDSLGEFADVSSKLGALEQPTDFGVVALVFGVVVYGESAAQDRALARTTKLHAKSAEPERGNRPLDHGKRHAEVDQRRNGHVPGDAALSIEEQQLPATGATFERGAAALELFCRELEARRHLPALAEWMLAMMAMRCGRV